jgi:hypothetical protein
MMKRPLFAFLANTAMARGAAPGSGLGSTSLFPGMQIEQAKCPMPPVRRQSELLKARG